MASGAASDWPWYRKAQAERGVRGWSYAEVARRIGEAPEQVIKWMKGHHSPRFDVVEKMARLFGWPIELFTNPTVAYVLGVTRHQNDAWVKAVLRGLTEDAKRVVAALSDEPTAEYLARCLEQYRILQERMKSARHDRPSHRSGT